jgi:hypothetical protein
MAQQGEAVHHRHEQIGNDDVRRVESRRFQRCGAVMRLLDNVPVARQQSPQEVQVFFLVIDDENARHTVAKPAGGGGSPKRMISSRKVSGLIGFSM